MKTRAGTVLAAPNETGLPEIMLRQILSWPSKVHVDEVAAILFEGVRAGHARASTTLDSYSHLLGGEDSHAANVANDILRRTLR